MAAQEVEERHGVSSSETGEAGRERRLPSWIRIGAELRARAEVTIDSEQAFDDRQMLGRVRVNVLAQPVRWMRVYFEGQDARAFRLNAGLPPEGGRNSFDVRQGYIEFGSAEQGFQARIGRQELSVGDERLVGADNYWDPFGLAFDAVRLAYSGQRLQAQMFTGFRVEPGRQRPDGFDTGSRISGLTTQIKTGWRDGVIEPYLLWKRGGDSMDLMENPGHRDVVTPGFRVLGNMASRIDYNVEMALQRGHVVGDRISAWGGHWEMGWRPLGADTGPRVSVEYNYGSGDKDPSDGRYDTFDDLFPAGFNANGITDPFAWRNIRFPAINAEVPLTRRWTAFGSWRSYWLATVRDGLYPGGDFFMVRNPDARSSHIGRQFFVSGAYNRSPRWRLYGGYGHLFPGDYLRQSGCPSAAHTVYLLSSVTF
ncbi:MAG: alginate export family protein [Bryobacterales bacterium]|nr:alginate export family protein [Bryobacterales bacterium]